ncbi:hypothetical protein DUI87_34778 [Hirundo rustica rustica]|uniref:Uncharacterized protein n=1 Tax=Hirundo rustica rustica TaxID=333673 RepID=A0A3M0IJA0_HIRRU|nr:hypothetical protein DUI87_34778 [Hirundo rustica rustica]
MVSTHARASSGTMVWKGTDSWPCQLTRSCGALDPTRPRQQAQVVQGNDSGNRNADSLSGSQDLIGAPAWDLLTSRLIHPGIQGMQMTAMPIDPELIAKGKPDSLMILKAGPTRTQKKEPEEMLTEHKETTVAQEMLTKFEKECEKLDAAREMLEKLQAEMRESENLDYWEYRRN